MSKKLKVFYENIVIGFQTDAGKWVGKGLWMICLAVGIKIVFSSYAGLTIAKEFEDYKIENDVRWMQEHKLDSMRNHDLHDISITVNTLKTQQDLMMRFFGIKDN